MKNDYLHKRKEAVVLSYDQSKDVAPRVVAKGKGEIAHKILEKAEQHHIPIQEDPTLVELLGQLEIDEAIPEELYQVVAEIFAFLYKVDHSLKNNK
ncbi:FlhB-like flagellar biosynthesis protein [Calidifontibacillus erzurumensis]|uniref:FlhB-like flagellar biosynthesis protein n=1 Tax=Calidifontibacillus erzurumensis TaxID=2741433 RepID=A0A8J8GCB6_9BACI|nr:FlhB-like flagellar biosynthesis protein [Calidifontibacillus erzurumensis]NSL51199.1 FlhB-like flagellar biosynthesis protein [Calidifontibacillus erzurumensis]